MIKVTGTRGPAPAAGPRRAAASVGAFALETPRAADAAPATALAPAETLAALIALQSEEGRRRRARSLSSAQGSLVALDRLRMSLLEGSASTEDLDALERAAAAGADADDSAIASLCDEIRLRVRVELAKRGR